MTEAGVGTRPALFQVRIHGRGGQGAVTAAELLSVAAFSDGYEAQAFPSFGSERTGAPVMSFCRISPTRIRVREPVAEPDAVLVIDATLLHHVDVFAGLRDNGYVVINSERTPAELGIAGLAERLGEGHIVTVPATELARKYIGRPVPNVALLGAFAATTRQVSLPSIETAIGHRFNAKIAEANVRTVRAAYAAVPELTLA